MKNFAKAACVYMLVGALLAAPLWAKSARFELTQDATLNGVTLEAGKYKIEINGENEAHIFSNGNLIVKANCEVKPLGNSIANSVRQNSDGELLEVRLKKERVVFTG